MKKPKIHKKHGPEYKIQNDIIKFLKDRGWHTERIVGNAFQYGLPDLYAIHRKWGQRWIEVKYKERYDFTPPQKQKFPILDSFGLGIWVLTAATEEEYDKLFDLPNWKYYWKDSYGEIDIDTLLEELNA